jgi:hypothetical protein
MKKDPEHPRHAFSEDATPLSKPHSARIARYLKVRPALLKRKSGSAVTVSRRTGDRS